VLYQKERNIPLQRLKLNAEGKLSGPSTVHPIPAQPELDLAELNDRSNPEEKGLLSELTSAGPADADAVARHGVAQEPNSFAIPIEPDLVDESANDSEPAEDWRDVHCP